MATTNPFLSIRQKAGDTEKSLNWYQTQVKELATVRPEKLMKNVPDTVTRILPGNMYMFFYDAKLKDTLPYWDRFPLVLPFRKVNEGFIGLNIHYLPYATRFKLLGALHNFAMDDKLNEDTRIRITWNIIESASRLAPAKACVKHYLYEHVQSRFLHIKFPDWVIASQLPVERFVGANKATVWRESRTKY